MTTYLIESSAGVTLGYYKGIDTLDALDAMARDAGYTDYAESVEAVGPFDGTITKEAR